MGESWFIQGHIVVAADREPGGRLHRGTTCEGAIDSPCECEQQS